MRTYVFVDVETTGIRTHYAEMIEVSALRWEDGEIVDSLSTLLKPKDSIPEEITQITGITDAMVKKAPKIDAVRADLRRVIGDAVVVGHNVDFDLGFLQEEFLAIGNHKLDTVTLSSILFPTLGRYGLQNLIQLLGIPSNDAHRAEADARATIHLFGKLFDKAMETDIGILEEIILVGQKLGWPETLFFEEVYQLRAKAAFAGGKTTGLAKSADYHAPKLDGDPLPIPDEDVEPVPIDAEIVTGILRNGSNFSQVFPGFEERPQQIQMTSAVVSALNNGKHLLVEAGTGTGKSLAYLIPSAFWATQNSRRVVISTNTINLQDQLVQKDIPALQKVLPFEVNVAIRKGKSNYLCTRLYQQLRHRGPADKDEMALFARILMWLGETKTGDVNEISLRSPSERMLWRKLSGENATCSRQECASASCPLHVARTLAEQSHILIVNHALLLADVANNNHILPYFSDLIVDEAHHFESAVTDGLSFKADKNYMESILEEVAKPDQGILGDLQKQVSDRAEVKAKFGTITNQLRVAAEAGEERLDDFFTAVVFFADQYTKQQSDFSQAVRLLPDHRNSYEFKSIVDAWENLNLSLKTIGKGYEQLAGGINDLGQAGEFLDTHDELQATIESNGRSVEELREKLGEILGEYDPALITWVEVSGRRISLNSAPLHIGPLVEEHIFDKLSSAILTSATMRTAPKGRYTEANFDYMQDRLSAEKAKTLSVGSPFQYDKNALVYLCTDMPDPREPMYQEKVEQAIFDVAKTLGGRTLVLFTSYRQLQETASALTPALAEHNIQVLAQLKGTSRQILTEQFKQPDARAVLLGTRSFWEGVDIPGDALKAVVIAKLPFDVPSDPIIAARSETFDSPFFEYTIPEAVLRFRQGFGRLIRRNTDEGAVVVLDKRLLTKRYGELFINALPNAVTIRQRVGRLEELIERWEKRDRA